MSNSAKFFLVIVTISLLISSCTPYAPSVKIPTATKRIVTSTNKIPTATKIRPTATPKASTSESNSVTGTRHFEEDGGFSYIPPKGWEFYEIPGFKYQGLMDSNPTGAFSSNVVFVDEAYSGSIYGYVEASLEMSKQYFADLKIFSVDEIETDSGLRGYSASTTNVIGDIQMIQTLFFFDLGEKNLVITYTCNMNESTSNIIKIGDLIESIQKED